MSSYRGQQQVSRPASLPGALHPQLAQQHCGQNHSTPKLDSGLEDEVDTDTDDIDLQQQHAELYDSEADDKDEQWMQQQRQGRQSDAILSCPGCLTTVCIDCQRHEFYTTQYRAMFVMNCRFDQLTILFCQNQSLRYLVLALRSCNTKRASGVQNQHCS